MTATLPPGTGTDTTGRGPRRGRAVLVVLAVVVAAVVVLAFLAPAQRRDGVPLDPRSTTASGTAAAVELARHLGADVSITSDLPDTGTDVAVMFEDLASDEVADELLGWVRSGGTLVVADPASVLAPEADYVPIGGFGGPQTVGRGRCDVDRPTGVRELRALESYGPVAAFDVPPGATSCFGGPDGAVVVVQAEGAGLLVSVGTPWVFTNEALDRADDAGLFAALAVPREGAVVAILEAGPDGTGVQPPDDDDLGLPDGVSLALLQLFVAFVVYAVHRGRRLGRPVPEDPPVEIAGSELVRAVGGLLEHAGARERAAASLRRAARRRLAGSFGLPVATPPEGVVDAVADRSGTARERLAELLLDAPVADDAALARLGRDLDDVVAAALAPPTAPPADGPASGGPL